MQAAFGHVLLSNTPGPSRRRSAAAPAADAKDDKSGEVHRNSLFSSRQSGSAAAGSAPASPAQGPTAVTIPSDKKDEMDVSKR